MLRKAVVNRILTIDVGGTFLKGTLLNERGEIQDDYRKIDTPRPCSPGKLLYSIQALAATFVGYNRVSIGFPGYVNNGIVYTAPQLDTAKFAGFNLVKELEDELQVPVRMVNDADLQGLGVANGVGYEMLITLGTGVGSAFLLNGTLLPHMELSQHPITDQFTYDHYLGARAFQEVGIEQWNQRVQKVFKLLPTVFNYDYLYIGGGNSCYIACQLDENMRIVTNEQGIRGGARLWNAVDHQTEKQLTDTVSKAKKV